MVTKLSKHEKHVVLLCMLISVFLIIISALGYPGGSLYDQNSVGFDWTKNFISNLFQEQALNGAKNTVRIWALLGITFYSLGYSLFFFRMSKKIALNHPATVLKFVGLANLLFTVLIATPLHDIMVTISSTLALLGLFYITVYIFRTKLRLFKFFCVISLLIFYYTLFLYGSGDWGLLAVMQKITLICSMLLALGLEYFTKPEDFEQINKA